VLFQQLPAEHEQDVVVVDHLVQARPAAQQGHEHLCHVDRRETDQTVGDDASVIAMVTSDDPIAGVAAKS
jgi:hypothetical protein